MLTYLRRCSYTDDWEQCKLGNVGEITAGGDKDSKKIRETGKYPVIANNLENNGIIGYYENDYKVEAPAITITARGNIGNAIARFTNFSPVVRLLVLKTKEDTKFMEQVINKIDFFIESTGVPQLTVPQLSKYSIFLPDKVEQNQIGKIFKVMDNLVTLYERKYQLYLLQFQKLQGIIFDNSDDFIPLSSLIEIKTGNRNSQDNIKNGKYVFFDRSTEVKRLNGFDFDEEAIILPGEGTKFAPKYVNGKYALHQRSYSLYNFSQKIDSKYLYYFLMTQSNTLLRYSVGTTVPSLRVSTFDHIKVPMYSKKLQIKYALTFDSLEKLMNQIKEKTNILKSLKQFLLQVLFL